MSTPSDVLVVGASAAGLATAEALRRNGYRGGLTLLDAEDRSPYDRPPLSKQVLSGAWEPERAHLRPRAVLDALGAEFVLGDPAVGLDVGSRTVHTAAGRALRADTVVLATGSRARRFPGQIGLAGTHVIRGLDDAVALRTDLLAASRVVVVGEGVLGAEVAATACGMGLDVTLAGPLAAPMAGQVGPLVAGLLADLHAEHGVRLRLGTGVVGFTDTGGRVDGVRLDTGEVLPADVVVVAIGATPATEWLVGSGLSLHDGVLCDSRSRAAEGIYAAGDVARWQPAGRDGTVRLENRTNATAQAAVVAANILGADEPYAPTPFFWTDQFDAKLQVHGVLPPDAEVRVVEGDLAARRFVVRYELDGVVTGVLGWNMPKQTRLRRQDVVDALAVPAPPRLPENR